MEGLLLLQVDKAIDLIFTKYFKALVDYEGIQRTETYCELLNLKESRTKVILQGLSDHIEIIGSNRDRRYKKK